MNAPPGATRIEVGLIYATGLAQGLALVTFPAASSIFTNPAEYGFSSARYGLMFLPQVLLAIAASSLAPKFAKRWGLKFVLVAGVIADFLSMSLLASSKFLLGSPHDAFGLLLIATAALGLGFGATVMALNTYVESFFPEHSDGAVLGLNALLGTGTALAPLLIAVFLGFGIWWGLPIMVASMLALIAICALKQPLRPPSIGSSDGRAAPAAFFRQLPSRFWLYAAVVFLYGIAETLNGNWATLYLTLQRGVSIQKASLALTSFWAMVTIGRILFAVLPARVPVRWIYLGLPGLLIFAFQFVSRANGQMTGILTFGFAGLACSAFFPLSISFAGEEAPRLASVMSGELIAFYQLGYGVAAFGMAPLHDLTRLPFSAMYSCGSAVAVCMVGLAWLLTRRNCAPRAAAG